MSIEDLYPFNTAEESVISRDWAAGSAKQHESRELLIEYIEEKYVGKYENITYPPALLKIIDEPIVNALDHLVRCLGSSNPVTMIRINFNADGNVRVYNNGPGIPVEEHKIASEKLGRKIMLPTFLFGTLFQGSNKKRDDASIIGGVNGLGAKLSNCFSSKFILETVCDGKYFLQQWRDHKNIADEPVILDLKSHPKSLPKDKTVPHTTLSFMPDYSGLFGYGKFDETVYRSLLSLIRTRVFFAAAYAHYTIAMASTKQSLQIYFNDEMVPVRNMQDIAKILFPGGNIAKTIMQPEITNKAPHHKYPWEIVIVYDKLEGLDYISNVNGVVVRDGKHIKHINKQIYDGVKEKIFKQLKNSDIGFPQSLVTDKIFIMINSKIPNPSWTGQRKDVLDMDVAKLRGYVLDDKFINTITATLRNGIMDNLLGKKRASKKKKTEYKKYREATFAGSKQSMKCSLIAVEGDSAMSVVNNGVSGSLGFDYYGTISLGGVIMNVRKECSVIETSAAKYIKKSKKLTNNIFINVLMEVTGLDAQHKYEPTSSTYRKEMDALRYGSFIICVDQDLDGMGNILGLLLNAFEQFWPNLLHAGYVKWLSTPIIRAYPHIGCNVKEFYNVQAYESWANNVDTSKYDIKYYKGLGGHNDDETASMFSKFHQNLYTYGMDKDSHELFEIYYGSIPDLRKTKLSAKSQQETIEDQRQIESTKHISCSYHLEHQTNAYQKDNLERKLDSEIDGQNQAGRKILHGIIKALSQDKRMKVDALGGFISMNENYHHGQQSLESSIIGRGMIAAGGKQLPFVIPHGNFGSRNGDDASPARYIHASLNKRITDLVLPKDDYHMLPFNFDEGKRSEPKYFVPIIPLAILESTEIPAHGWKLKLWARDIFVVIKNVKYMIEYGPENDLIAMPPTRYAGSKNEWKGEFKTIRGELYSFGKYNLHGKILTITELPLRVWTEQYMEMLLKKEKADETIIDSIQNQSNKFTIKIVVKLKPGAVELLEDYGDSCFTDGIEEYFQLRDRMDSHINLYGIDGEIKTYDNYEDVLKTWFPVRKEYYIKRVNRKRILAQLEIKMYKNIIRYIENSNELKGANRKYIEMTQLLESHGYDKLYHVRINKPKFTPTEQLEHTILYSPDACYDYLLNLTDRKKSYESLHDYRKTLAKLESKLTEYVATTNEGSFMGSKLWLNELEQLEKEIKYGQETSWLYENNNKFKFV